MTRYKTIEEQIEDIVNYRRAVEEKMRKKYHTAIKMSIDSDIEQIAYNLLKGEKVMIDLKGLGRLFISPVKSIKSVLREITSSLISSYNQNKWDYFFGKNVKYEFFPNEELSEKYANIAELLISNKRVK